MSNVLSEAKKQQVIVLGRLRWPLRRIEQKTGVRRETAGAYLKAAGIGVRPAGAWGRRPPAKPANENEVTTGSDMPKPPPTINRNPNPENPCNKEKAKPANAILGTPNDPTVTMSQKPQEGILAMWKFLLNRQLIVNHRYSV
jgi:hypothetical protein